LHCKGLKYEKYERSKAIREKITEYMNRAEEIKRFLAKGGKKTVVHSGGATCHQPSPFFPQPTPHDNPNNPFASKTMSLPKAAKNGDFAKVKKLLGGGANIEEKDEYGKTCDCCHAVALSCFPRTLAETLRDSFQTELKNTAIISDESAPFSWSQTNPDP
jgi:hypothetical protein